MNDIDEKVIAAIRGGANTNGAIQVAVLGKRSPGGYSRPIDLALQKLRRDGVVLFLREKWSLNKTKPCAECTGPTSAGCAHDARRGAQRVA